MRTAALRLAVVVLTLIGLGASARVAQGTAARSPAPATRVAHTPCRDWAFTDPSKSKYKAVKIPHTKAAYVLGPKTSASAKHAGIVLLHGANGDECSLWWAARLLAGRNYVTVTVRYKPNTLAASDAAGRGALNWLRTSTKNPYHHAMAVHDLAIIGHSLGAHAAADLQQTEDVRTIVALDNLRAYLKGDRSAGTTCNSGPSEPVKAVVPALSLGSETDCWGAKANKLTGFLAWLSRGVPVLQATLAHSTHTNFTGQADHTRVRGTQLFRAENYIVPWLNIWLRNHTDAYPDLIAGTIGGVKVSNLLSSKRGYGSAAYLPKDGTWHGRQCFDLRLRQCGSIAR